MIGNEVDDLVMIFKPGSSFEKLATLVSVVIIAGGGDVAVEVVVVVAVVVVVVEVEDVVVSLVVETIVSIMLLLTISVVKLTVVGDGFVTSSVEVSAMARSSCFSVSIVDDNVVSTTENPVVFESIC